VTASYDSQKVQNLSAAISQIGNEVNGVWVDQSGAYPAFGRDFPFGISFDFSVTNESGRGLALAPRIPFTAVTQDLAGTGETSEYWTLTLETLNNTPPDVNISLYATYDPAPDPWVGSTNTPTLQRASLGGAFLIEAITAASSNWVTDPDSGQQNMVFELDFTTNLTEALEGGALMAPLIRTINDPLWAGLLQFHLELVGSPFSISMVAAGLTFTGNTHRWHTGMMGAQMDLRGRAVHDHITGQPYMSTKAVADGYRDGIMVHPDNFDPADPLEENPWTPPPGEGEVDDELTDVE
jgi:hypothetical protein